MSDLLFAPNGLTSPPDACYEAPPTATRGVVPPDACHMDIPFVEEGALASRRVVRFDRSGDQFILSPSNGLEIREWFEGHANTSQVYTTLRLFNGMIRVPNFRLSPQATHLVLLLAQYVANGSVTEVIDGSAASFHDQDVAQGLLQIFADNSESILGPFLGQLQVMRRGSWLSAEALERLRWVTSMIDVVPQYRSFRLHLLSESDLEHPEAARLENVTTLVSFAAGVVAADTLTRPLRYNQDFLAANDAYLALYGSEIEAGRRPDFCTALEEALSELRGARGGADGRFLRECRLALTLREQDPSEALLETFRSALTGEDGLGILQELIADESREANMTVDWLAQRGDADAYGRIGEILRVVIRHLRVEFVAAEDSEILDPDAPGGADANDSSPLLTLDVPSLRTELLTLLDANPTTRREYLLAAIAILRRLARPGSESTVRVFSRDQFLEVGLSDENRAELRRLLAFLEGQRETSQERSDILLPIMEGVVCAVGGAGLALSEALPEIRRDGDLRLGIGLPSAGLIGAGCTSLIGHFIWPEVAEPRNDYLWDGVTGLIGAALGVGTYLLIHFLGGGNPMAMDPGDRFPVDPYGP